MQPYAPVCQSYPAIQDRPPKLQDRSALRNQLHLISSFQKSKSLFGLIRAAIYRHLHLTVRKLWPRLSDLLHSQSSCRPRIHRGHLAGQSTSGILYISMWHSVNPLITYKITIERQVEEPNIADPQQGRAVAHTAAESIERLLTIVIA